MGIADILFSPVKKKAVTDISFKPDTDVRQLSFSPQEAPGATQDLTPPAQQIPGLPGYTLDTANPVAQMQQRIQRAQSEVVKNYLTSPELSGEKPVNIARSLSDEDYGMVSRTILSDLGSYPKSVTSAFENEAKIRAAKKGLESDTPAAQNAIYAFSNLGNMFNVNEYLDRQGLNPFNKGQYAANTAAINRIIAERPFSLKSLGFTAGVQIPKILTEFAFMPNIAGKIKMLGKFPKLKAMVSAGLKFGAHAVLQAPEEGETIGDRLKSVGTSTALGTGVGMSGAFIPAWYVRAPVNIAGFSLLTAARGGTKEDIMETAFTIAGFEALGLLKQAARVTSAKVRTNLENKAIKVVRANGVKAGLDLKGVPDDALRSILKGQKEGDRWKKWHKKGKVSQEVKDQRLGEIADNLRPVLDAIAQQQPTKTPPKQRGKLYGIEDPPTTKIIKDPTPRYKTTETITATPEELAAQKLGVEEIKQTKAFKEIGEEVDRRDREGKERRGEVEGKVVPSKLSDKEFPIVYRQYGDITLKGEKDPTRAMTTEERELWGEHGENWEEFSRSRGYSEQEIEDFRYWIELNQDPRAEAVRGYEDLVSTAEPAVREDKLHKAQQIMADEKAIEGREDSDKLLENLLEDVGPDIQDISFKVRQEPDKDLLGREELQGGAAGKQTEFLDKEDFKTQQEKDLINKKGDIEGQGKLFKVRKGEVKGKLGKAIDTSLDIAKKLNIDVDVEVSDATIVDRSFDPSDPKDLKELKKQGFSGKEIRDAKSKGEKFIAAGYTESIVSPSGQKRSRVVVFDDSTPAELRHEVFGHALQDQGGLPGWQGKPEEIADYIAEAFEKGEEGKVIELRSPRIPGKKHLMGIAFKVRKEEGGMSRGYRQKLMKQKRDAITSHDLYEINLPEGTELDILRTHLHGKISFGANYQDIADYVDKIGPKAYLWRYIASKGAKGQPWDEVASELAGITNREPVTDPREFVELMDRAIQAHVEYGGINIQSIEKSIGDDPGLALDYMIFDMLRNKFSVEEINENVKKELAEYKKEGYDIPESEFLLEREAHRVKKSRAVSKVAEKKAAAGKRPAAKEVEKPKKDLTVYQPTEVRVRGVKRKPSGKELAVKVLKQRLKKARTEKSREELQERLDKLTGKFVPPVKETQNIVLRTEVLKLLEEKGFRKKTDDLTKLSQGARRLAIGVTGSPHIRKMTDEQLAAFGRAISRLPEPTKDNKGRLIPPPIPKTTAITTKGFFEKKFKEPSILREFRSQEVYAKKLGIKSLVSKAEIGKIKMTLEYNDISNQIARQIKLVEKLGKTTTKEKAQAFIKNQPTAAVRRFMHLLDTHEEAPDSLNPAEKRIFNWFRDLTRLTLKRENEIRESLGIELIPSRKAYVRHISQGIAQEVLAGRYPFPEGKKFWAEKIIAKKIFNPMENKRKIAKLEDDVEHLFTEYLEYATKAMMWTALKEIHLSKPIRFMEQQLTMLGKDLPVYKTLTPDEQRRWDKVSVIPSRTRKWVRDYINVVIKGQQSEIDQDINAIVTQTGLKGVMNTVLAKFNRSLSHKPLSSFFTAAGRFQILGVLGGFRPKQLLRNKFQLTQNLALYPTAANVRAFRAPSEKLKKLLDKSLFLETYTGTEDWPVDIMGKASKVGMAAFQWSAQTNARQAMEVAYWATLPLITDKKFAEFGWADQKRTYNEKPEFLYKSEEEAVLKEMEWGAAATQFNYTAIGMPQIFRHKTLTPVTRLTSWWMNYYGRFIPEALSRFTTGRPGWTEEEGPTLPWTFRMGWLRYMILGGLILNTMDYTRSYLFGVAPTGVPPAAQFIWYLYRSAVAIGSGDDIALKRSRKKMMEAAKTFIPFYLSAKDLDAALFGGKPLKSLLFYNKRKQKKKGA